jgi:hypothetical protein
MRADAQNERGSLTQGTALSDNAVVTQGDPLEQLAAHIAVQLSGTGYMEMDYTQPGEVRV